MEVQRNSSLPEKADLYPVIFLQRHALELMLKDCLLCIYQIKKHQHDLDTTVSKPSARRIKRVTQKHNINDLFKDLEEAVFRGLPEESAILDKLKRLVDTFHSIDQSSTQARYHEIDTVSYKRFCRKQVDVDVDKNQRNLDEIFSELFGSDLTSYDGMMQYYYDLHAGLENELVDRG